MPIGSYFKGSGRKVMNKLKSEYGSEDGERTFFALANKNGMKPPKIKNDVSSAGMRELGRPRLKRNIP